MTSNTTGDAPPSDGQRLALHVLSRRVMYAARTLSQAELAHVAHMSRRQLRRWEATKRLPTDIARFVMLAMALNTTPDLLIAPAMLANLRDAVNERRAELDLPPSRVMTRPVRPRVLAMCKRDRAVGYAVVEPEHVRFLTRTYVGRCTPEARPRRMVARARELATQFGCRIIVAEPALQPLFDPAEARVVTVQTAYEQLGPTEGDATGLGPLLARLLDNYPALRGHVPPEVARTIGDTQAVNVSSDRLVAVLAAAFGLAFFRRALKARGASLTNE